MKIQCNVCDAAAAVLCCADEAALCLSCDEKVHAANKLASKHQRIPLLNSSSQMPKCDICQKSGGYFFCLEDKALLCRKCDVSIHTINSLVSSHQRFLLTGVKVGIKTIDPVASLSTEKSNSDEKITEAEKSHFMPARTVEMSTTSQPNKVINVQASGDFGGSPVDDIQQWQFDDFLTLTDFGHDYNYLDNGSSKADIGKLAESDGSPILRAMGVEPYGSDCLGQVPDASWAVPEMSSPPAASRLYWPDHHHELGSDTFVPDVCYSPAPNFHGSRKNTASIKRRRNL